MPDITLDFEPDVVIIKAQTPLGREVLKSLMGASERSIPWGQAKPLLQSLERASELHSVSIGGPKPCVN